MAHMNFTSNCSLNVTSSDDCSQSYFNLDNSFSLSFATKMGRMTAYAFVAVLALLGNVFVIVIIGRNKPLRKAVNLFILNMAISDLVTPVVIIPIQLYSLAVDSMGSSLAWPFGGHLGSFFCKLAMFLADSSPVISIMSLVFMTADRFYAVVFPLKAHGVSFKMRLALLTTTWLIGFGFFSLYFQVVHIAKVEDRFFCELSFAPTFNHVRSMQIFATTACVLFTITPFLLLSVMYSVMLFILKKETFATPQSQKISLQRRRNHRNIIFMALIIVLTFAVCWGPYNGFIFVITIVWRWKLPPDLDIDFATFNFVTHFLTCTNAVLNPCIYFIFIRSYRSALRSLICSIKKPRKYIIKGFF